MITIEGNKIEAVLLDFGGVLYPVDYGLTIKAFELLGVKNFNEIFSKERQASFSDEFEKGLISRSEFYNTIRDLAGIEASDEALQHAWNAILLGLDLKKLAFVQQLRAKVPVYLLSNTNEVHIEQINVEVRAETEEFGSLDPFFEKVYLSHEIHMRKPDTEIFEFICKDIGVKPENLFFVDDSPQHVVGATKVGCIARYLDVENGEQVEGYFNL